MNFVKSHLGECTSDQLNTFFQISADLEKSEEKSVQVQTKFLYILGKVGFQSDQITAASWSGNTCQPSNQLIITLIRLLFNCDLCLMYG